MIKFISTVILGLSIFLLKNNYKDFLFLYNDKIGIYIGLGLLFSIIFRKISTKLLGILSVGFILWVNLSFYNLQFNNTQSSYIIGACFFVFFALLKKIDGKFIATTIPTCLFLFIFDKYGYSFISDYVKGYNNYVYHVVSVGLILSLAPVSSSIHWLITLIIDPITSLFHSLFRIKPKRKNQNVNITMEEIDKFGHGAKSQTVKGDMFEDFIAICWRKLGYEAYTVAEIKEENKRKSNPRIPLPKEVNFDRADKGLDVVVFMKDNTVKLIQAKHYSNPLGDKPVEEVVKAHVFWKNCFNKDTKFQLEVWTNNTFKKSAYQYAKKVNVGLVGRKKLAHFLVNDLKNNKIKETLQEVKD